MDVVKTCSNCKYYCGCLVDPHSKLHIHDYCIVWRATIPAYYLADKESPDDVIVYDDIETNRAVCWCFEEVVK